MPSWVPDLVIVVLLLGVTYALASEGAWGAALMFFNVLFAGLIAFNFYEPVADLVMGWGMAGSWSEFVALGLIFLVSLVLLRVATDTIAPAMVRLPTPVYHLGRVVFGLGTAAMLMGILLCLLYTAPVDRKLFGKMNYDTRPPYKLGLDHRWLAFVQWSSGAIFPTYSEDNDPDAVYDTANVFDPEGAWLVNHQNARPYPADNRAGFVPSQEESGQ